MRVAGMTWMEVRRALTETDLLIYPLGATETYGPHLPTGLETVVADRVAERLAERMPALVMPTLPISCSQVNDAFPGNLFLSPVTLRDLVLESTRCLTRFGVGRVFFLNVHGPNLYPLEEVIRELIREGVRCAQSDFWRFVARRCRDLLSDDPHATGHAGELATAMMLYLDAGAVRADRYQVARPSDGIDQEYVVPDVNFHRPWNEVSPSGHLGDPAKASAEQGGRILERTVEAYVELLQRWSAEG